MNIFILLLMLLTILSGCTNAPVRGLTSVELLSTSQSNLIARNILRRVFRIAYGTDNGTGFTIEVAGKQYLVTANHIFDKLPAADTIKVFRSNVWVDYHARMVGRATPQADIIVLALDRLLTTSAHTPEHELPVSVGSDGIILSQECFFLGFPYGVLTNSGQSDGYPLPLVRKALLSGFVVIGNTSQGFYLDGTNNPGFSGGPLVNARMDPPQIFGVVTGFGSTKQPVFGPDDKPTKMYYQYNTGIIVAFDIHYALDIIAKNPIGFPMIP
jgi:hypothetical protein